MSHRSLFPCTLFSVVFLLSMGGCSSPTTAVPAVDPTSAQAEPAVQGLQATNPELESGWMWFGREASDHAPGIEIGHPTGWSSRGRGDWNAGSLLLQAPASVSELLAFQCQWFAKGQEGPSSLLAGEGGLAAFISAGFPGAVASSSSEVSIMREPQQLLRFDHPPDEGKPGETILVTVLDLGTHWGVVGGLLRTADVPVLGAQLRRMLESMTMVAPDRARPLPSLPADHPAASEGSAAP